MRLATILVPIAFLSIACSSTSSGGGNGNGGTGQNGGAATGAGTCESACVYYLGCKGADTPDNRTLCNQKCVAQGYTAQQLSDFQKLDCANAVAAIENPQGNNGTSNKSSDCAGCQWDGSQCIYIPSNSGTSGVYSPCSASCC